MHHNFATVRHRVMWFSAKCSEKISLHDKSKCLNTVIKYSLFCSWQVKYLKTKLTEKSLRQICGVNKVPAKLELRETVLNVSTARTNNGCYGFNYQAIFDS